MSKSNWLSEIMLYVLITIFALGWIDIGFGAEYTWWNLLTLGG